LKHEEFERLSRRMAAAPSRRGLLRIFAGGLAATATAALLPRGVSSQTPREDPTSTPRPDETPRSTSTPGPTETPRPTETPAATATATPPPAAPTVAPSRAGAAGCPESTTTCGDSCCPAGTTCQAGQDSGQSPSCCIEDFALGTFCCPAGQMPVDRELDGGIVVFHKNCCPPARACDGLCCPDGQVCLGGACCDVHQICDSMCCPDGQSCNNGGCCPPGQVHCPGGGCCPSGMGCVATFDSSGQAVDQYTDWTCCANAQIAPPYYGSAGYPFFCCADDYPCPQSDGTCLGQHLEYLFFGPEVCPSGTIVIPAFGDPTTCSLGCNAVQAACYAAAVGICFVAPEACDAVDQCNYAAKACNAICLGQGWILSN
jgi:hypothetical protein